MAEMAVRSKTGEASEVGGRVCPQRAVAQLRARVGQQRRAEDSPPSLAAVAAAPTVPHARPLFITPGPDAGRNPFLPAPPPPAKLLPWSLLQRRQRAKPDGGGPEPARQGGQLFIVDRSLNRRAGGLHPRQPRDHGGADLLPPSRRARSRCDRGPVALRPPASGVIESG